MIGLQEAHISPSVLGSVSLVLQDLRYSLAGEDAAECTAPEVLD